MCGGKIIVAALNVDVEVIDCNDLTFVECNNFEILRQFSEKRVRDWQLTWTIDGEHHDGVR